MEVHARRPNILHLGGITMQDYTPIEDVFDEKVLEAVEGDEGHSPESLPFDKIPAVFTTLEEWPFSTNLKCWSCGFTFDGRPCFAPTFVRCGRDDRVEIGVEGNFCTFNCAGLYIDDTYPQQAYPAKHWRMRDSLCLVYHRFKDVRVHHIKPAPRKTELACYGGELDEEEFWCRMRTLDPQYGLRDHRPGTVKPERLRISGTPVWEISSGSVLSPTTAEMVRRVEGLRLVGKEEAESPPLAGTPETAGTPEIADADLDELLAGLYAL